MLILLVLSNCNIIESLKDVEPTHEGILETQGIAISSAKPDQVSISFQITTIEKTAAQALNENNDLVKKSILALKGNNLTNDEIGTSDFSIDSAYDYLNYQNGTSYTVFKGYKIQTTLNILTKKIDLAGSLIDSVISSGVQQINSVNFQISKEKRKILEEELLVEAVKNAKDKADLALGALKTKVNGLKSISLDNTPQPHIYKEQFAKNAEAYDLVSSGASNLYAQNQDIHVQVSVIFTVARDPEIVSVFNP